MTATTTALKQIFAAGRPLVEQAIDIAEQIAALRETATAHGLDWSQVKALLKAQILDERDGAGDGKRLRRVLDKAEFATAYADMLGLGGNMNEKNFSADDIDPATGEIIDVPPAPVPNQAAGATAAEGAPPLSAVTDFPDADMPDLPGFLRRRKVA